MNSISSKSLYSPEAAGAASPIISEYDETVVNPAEVHSTVAAHTLLDAFDLVVDLQQSRGAQIYDSKSKRTFLDFFSFVASMPIGMNHPRMLEPEFLDKLAYVAVNKPTNSDALTVEFAEFLATFSRIAMPEYFPHVFFIEGGSLAVENALKAAFDWKVRKNFEKGYHTERGSQVIHFRQSFHGRSGYTLSLTNTDPAKTDYFPKFPWPRIHNPAIMFPLNASNLRTVEQSEQAALSQIDQAITKNPDDIAAIILEPIQGEGGDNHFRKEFLQALRQVADENEIMLIFDEVQTGVGLTGTMWAHEQFVRPDMMTFGKKTQVCGFMASTRIDEVANNVFNTPSRLNSTWGGNLVDMVRSQRYLEIIAEERLVDHAAAMGKVLVNELQGLQGEFPQLVSNARGRGLFCAFDLPTTEQRNALRKSAYANGLIILGSGERSMRFRPPLNISKEEIESGVDILRKSLHGMQK